MLYLTAVNPTDSVLEGFLPAAKRLGLSVTVLTDQPEVWPMAVSPCDVRDPRAVIEAARGAQALLSNSDHLQVPTALAADYLGLPGKDWRACLRAKDKHLMRRALLELDNVSSILVRPGEPVPEVPLPAVVKPREGVASEDVFFVASQDELRARVTEIHERRPITLVVEEYLDGPLHTFETLGDAYLGGWRTTLGPPPTFIETALDWHPYAPAAQVWKQLRALGIGFGACHTEYVLQDGRPRLIEVNYRLIGDRMDLVLAELLGIPLFEQVIRLYLGHPPTPIRLPDTTARVEYVCAERSGVLTQAPPASELCRPLRRVGDRIEVTGTNRDYLAVLHADSAETLREFRNRHQWVIS